MPFTDWFEESMERESQEEAVKDTEKQNSATVENK